MATTYDIMGYEYDTNGSTRHRRGGGELAGEKPRPAAQPVAPTDPRLTR